jgi:hypothetical protein
MHAYERVEVVEGLAVASADAAALLSCAVTVRLAVSYERGSHYWTTSPIRKPSKD